MCHSTPKEVGEQLLDVASLLLVGKLNRGLATSTELAEPLHYSPHYTRKFSEPTGTTCSPCWPQTHKYWDYTNDDIWLLRNSQRGDTEGHLQCFHWVLSIFFS